MRNSIFLKPLIFTMLVMAGLFHLFSMRFTIAVPKQSVRCLHARFLLIDKWDTDVAIGDLVYFKFASNAGPLYEGAEVVKKVVAMGGQTIDFDEWHVVVDGVKAVELDMTQGLARTGQAISELNTHLTLNDGELFVMGETPLSYDSRYWGPIKQEKIMGTAYAIY
ncbi:signal peptidase I [Alteromonas gilva]|uniref:Signal peptidase I n=1 Tax=Alteromonas gilva TaxID=2987522 RepID=A0ABT5L7A9_9ALTE|nr:signal peptidase I [Alteromonas gilva]MDC8832955.1 signal peptidase I [Alteromonas gilva]